MTDPLLRIEAVIEELGSPQAGIWTPLDTSPGQVSNAKPWKTAALDTLDGLDTRNRTLSRTDRLKATCLEPTATQKQNEPLARRVLFMEVSKVSKVSKTMKKHRNINLLALDTWGPQVSKIGHQASKDRRMSG